MECTCSECENERNGYARFRQLHEQDRCRSSRPDLSSSEVELIRQRQELQHLQHQNYELLKLALDLAVLDQAAGAKLRRMSANSDATIEDIPATRISDEPIQHKHKYSVATVDGLVCTCGEAMPACAGCSRTDLPVATRPASHWAESLYCFYCIELLCARRRTTYAMSVYFREQEYRVARSNFVVYAFVVTAATIASISDSTLAPFSIILLVIMFTILQGRLYQQKKRTRRGMLDDSPLTRK